MIMVCSNTPAGGYQTDRMGKSDQTLKEEYQSYAWNSWSLIIPLSQIYIME